MTFQILKNNVPFKTLTAKSMNSIYSQLNSFAKKKGCVSREDGNAIGMMVWISPYNDVFSLSRIA